MFYILFLQIVLQLNVAILVFSGSSVSEDTKVEFLLCIFRYLHLCEQKPVMESSPPTAHLSVRTFVQLSRRTVLNQVWSIDI